MRRRWLELSALLLVFAILTAQTLPFPSGGVSSSVSSGPSGPQSLFPNGSVTAPSIAFASQPAFGFYRAGSSLLALTQGTTPKIWITSTPNVVLPAGASFAWSPNTDASSTPDAAISRISTVASAVQVQGNNFTGTGTLMMNRLVATGSSPNCIDNCGAAGASTVVGTDQAWRLTISTANAQSNFAIGFRTAYTGAPNCVAQLGGTGTASVASTNSTATGVTVNLTTAPSNGQIYHGQCFGLTAGP